MVKKTIFLISIILVTVRTEGMATANYDESNIKRTIYPKKSFLKRSYSWSAENSSKKRKKEKNFQIMGDNNENIDINLRKREMQNKKLLLHILEEVNQRKTLKIEELNKENEEMRNEFSYLSSKIEKLDKENAEMRNEFSCLSNEMEKIKLEGKDKETCSKNLLKESSSTSILEKFMDHEIKCYSPTYAASPTYDSNEEPTLQEDHYLPDLSIIQHLILREGYENIISKF